VRCAAGLIAGCEGGEAGEVGFGEEERVEPVNSAFVTGGMLLVVENSKRRGMGHTLFVGSQGWIFVSRQARGCAGI
jgi:hypothetical protein